VLLSQFFLGERKNSEISSLSGGEKQKLAVVLALIPEPEVWICAAGLMGIPLTFSGYRHEKILKRYRVTPVSPMMLLAALGTLQAIFAWVSGLCVFLAARFCFGMTIEGPLYRYILTFLFVQFSVYSIGFLVASLVPNMKVANLVCTMLYFPMLFLSGSTVPFEILPRGLQMVSEFFPLTQGILLLKGAVLGTPVAADSFRFVVLGCMTVIAFAVSIVTFRWE
jgi:ABC-2 type transport system permease protein